MYLKVLAFSKHKNYRFYDFFPAYFLRGSGKPRYLIGVCFLVLHIMNSPLNLLNKRSPCIVAASEHGQEQSEFADMTSKVEKLILRILLTRLDCHF